jgi:WD40 repeat protein
MGNILQRDAIVQHRFTTPRREKRYGTLLPSILFHVFSLVHSAFAHESAGRSGDLYVRSVRFSPEGKFLATGAEDKLLRVRFFGDVLHEIWLIGRFRFGTLQRSVFGTFLTVTNKRFMPLTFPLMDD